MFAVQIAPLALTSIVAEAGLYNTKYDVIVIR